MSDEIVFYHNPMSRGRMVHWMLEEVGVPYRIEILRFDRGENKKPAFLAVNPMGKIPTIVHRGTVITETGAIITKLQPLSWPFRRLIIEGGSWSEASTPELLS